MDLNDNSELVQRPFAANYFRLIANTNPQDRFLSAAELFNDYLRVFAVAPTPTPRL